MRRSHLRSSWFHALAAGLLGYLVAATCPIWTLESSIDPAARRVLFRRPAKVTLWTAVWKSTTSHFQPRPAFRE